jgi:hypothetical protein
MVIENRFLMAAMFMALLLSAVPVTRPLAQNATTFNATNCISAMQNAYMKGAQDKSVAGWKPLANGVLPDMKAVYCWNNILTAWAGVSEVLTAGLGGIWPVVAGIIKAIVGQVLNSVCAAVGAAVSSAMSYINSLVCLPIPSFHIGFNLGINMPAGGTCPGVGLLQLPSVLSGVRPNVPGAWSLFGLSKQF